MTGPDPEPTDANVDHSMDDSVSRHHLFATARTEARWSVQQLWVAYLAAGGTRDALDLEAYLYGMASISMLDQDVLATAVNERLYDLYQAACVPYLCTAALGPSPTTDPLTVLDDLLGQERQHDPDADDG